MYIVTRRGSEEQVADLHDALARSREMGPGALVLRASDRAVLAGVGDVRALLRAIDGTEIVAGARRRGRPRKAAA